MTAVLHAAEIAGLVVVTASAASCGFFAVILARAYTADRREQRQRHHCPTCEALLGPVWQHPYLAWLETTYAWEDA